MLCPPATSAPWKRFPLTDQASPLGLCSLLSLPPSPSSYYGESRDASSGVSDVYVSTAHSCFRNASSLLLTEQAASSFAFFSPFPVFLRPPHVLQERLTLPGEREGDGPIPGDHPHRLEALQRVGHPVERRPKVFGMGK